MENSMKTLVISIALVALLMVNDTFTALFVTIWAKITRKKAKKERECALCPNTAYYPTIHLHGQYHICYQCNAAASANIYELLNQTNPHKQ